MSRELILLLVEDISLLYHTADQTVALPFAAAPDWDIVATYKGETTAEKNYSNKEKVLWLIHLRNFFRDLLLNNKPIILLIHATQANLEFCICNSIQLSVTKWQWNGLIQRFFICSTLQPKCFGLSSCKTVKSSSSFFWHIK